MMGRLVNDMLAEYRARVAEPTLLARLAAFEPDLRAAVDKRNEFVHASWARIVRDGSVGSFERTRRPRKGTAREEFVGMTAAEVEATADFIGTIAEKLWWDLFGDTSDFLREAAKK